MLVSQVPCKLQSEFSFDPTWVFVSVRVPAPPVSDPAANPKSGRFPNSDKNVMAIFWPPLAHPLVVVSPLESEKDTLTSPIV